MSGTTSPLEGCRAALIKLEGLLPKQSNPNLLLGANGQASNSKKRICWTFKRKAAVADTILVVRPMQGVTNYENLKWPFKKAAAERLLNELARHKATLSLGLAVYTMYLYPLSRYTILSSCLLTLTNKLGKARGVSMKRLNIL